MENTKNYTRGYAIVSIVAVAYIIISDVMYYKYKALYFEPTIAISLLAAAPIVVAILSYIKMLLQSRTPIHFSSIINIGIIAITSVWTFVIFNPLTIGIIERAADNTVTMLFLCLQICALVYDFFRNRSEETVNYGHATSLPANKKSDGDI